jgi:DNA-binding transcriptional ArsR family regulator
MRPTQDNDVFHAVAHPARRAILLALRKGERPASALAAPFDMTFAAVSQHLKVLKDAALVVERRDGRRRLYQLQAKPLQEVARWAQQFEEFFNRRLDALELYLDRKHGRRAR